MLEQIKSAPSPDYGDFTELWELLYVPGADPVALAKGWRAQLQPIKPKSVTEFNMAFITMLAYDIKHAGKDIALFQPYLDTLLRLGLSSSDLRQQAYATWAYGAHIRPYQRLDESATYYLLSIQLYEKLPFFERMYAKYGALAEVLFHTGDYGPSIEYGRKALVGEEWIGKYYNYSTLIRYLNTMGQAYYHQDKMDSAAYYYKRSKEFAAQNQIKQWVAINSSFEGQLQLKKGAYREALVLFEEGYLGNKDLDAPIESFSLVGMGKAHFAMGQTNVAKKLLQEGLMMAEKAPQGQRWQVAEYRKDAFRTLGEINRSQNLPDSFYYYSNAALMLEDSMVKVVGFSNLRMANIRSQVEQYRLQAAMLTEKEDRSRMIRNFIITGIVLVASAIILLLSRQNRILQLQQQMAQVKQQAADAEVTAAREQLNLFTRRLHEKTELLEQLQQTESANDTALQLQMIQNLTRQAILTENDWQSFRASFDKIYPFFIMLLRQNAPDITVAEQRMAALSILNMNGKEMAAILGISPESVRKTRQRLRQRLNLESADDLVTCLFRLA
ncbi:MAG: transcriptional regulator [Bacteroidota bacterium]